MNRPAGTRRCGAILIARIHCACGLLLIGILAGCDRLDMYDQPRYESLEATKFFPDGMSARPRVEGTIARGGLNEDIPLNTGKDGKQLVSRIPETVYRAFYDAHPQRFNRPFDELSPVELRKSFLERGRERFDIYCSVCHGRTGDGNGMIVQRGFRRPPTYHSDRLRRAASGHLFDVITNGFGSMASYASRVEPVDRWAITAYLRALQLSQNAVLDDAPEDQRRELNSLESPDEPQSQHQEHSR